MSIRTLLFLAGALTTAGVTALVAQFTTSAVWAVGVGVAVGVLWMLLCAYTVDVIRARRRHNPTNDEGQNT